MTVGDVSMGTDAESEARRVSGIKGIYRKMVYVLYQNIGVVLGRSTEASGSSSP